MISWTNRRNDSQSLSLPCGPLRFDLNWALDARRVVIEAAPLPLLGTFDETTVHWISMDVTQLFNTLGFAPDVEIVVTWLPERGAFDWSQLVRSVLLEHLDDDVNLFRTGSLISRCTCSGITT